MASAEDNSSVWELQEKTGQARNSQAKGCLACPLPEKYIMMKSTQKQGNIRYNFTASRVLFKTINRVANRSRMANNLSLWVTLGLEVDNIC